MKSDEPSRMALMVAGQRAAHQLLDHGAILDDPYEPAALAAILRSHGFEDIEDISFQEVVSRFGRDVQGLATGQIGVHIVHANH